MIPGKQLKALLRMLRDQGVVSFKHDGLELLLDPNFRAPMAAKSDVHASATPSEALQEQVAALIPMPQLTDEQWLLSTNMTDPDESTSIN